MDTQDIILTPLVLRLCSNSAIHFTHDIINMSDDIIVFDGIDMFDIGEANHGQFVRHLTSPSLASQETVEIDRSITVSHDLFGLRVREFPLCVHILIRSWVLVAVIGESGHVWWSETTGERPKIEEHLIATRIADVVEQLLVVPGCVVFGRSDNQDIVRCPSVRWGGHEESGAGVSSLGRSSPNWEVDDYSFVFSRHKCLEGICGSTPRARYGHIGLDIRVLPLLSHILGQEVEGNWGSHTVYYQHHRLVPSVGVRCLYEGLQVGIIALLLQPICII